MRTGPRALVTGGAGFIGSHLADGLLAAGWHVTALDDLSTGSRQNVAHLRDCEAFDFVEGSVLDSTLVDGLVSLSDRVYHLAAAVGVQLIVDKPLESMVTNIKGTEIVLEAAGRHQTKILITSTSEIYGKNQNGKPFSEEDDRVLGPTNKLRWSYSVSKAVDEILAFVYYKERGLPTVVARLFNTVGPRQTGHYGMVVPRFISQALRGEPLTIYGDGEQRRVFTYVGDVVEALMLLMETKAAEGDVFNIAGSAEITITDLARLIIDMTESSSDLTYVSYEEVYGQGFEDMARRLADTSRLERVTGYRCRTTLRDTLEHMIEFRHAKVKAT
jgi:UDP-glucose 4-epimerase